MASIKGTQTEKNLLKSFAGESQACNRYTFFAKAAHKEGYVKIANLFVEIANQEVQHAKRFFSFLEGGDVEITAAYPAGKVGVTLDNLKAAATGELEEHSHLYPEFAKIAREESLEAIAELFEAVSVAELSHERQFLSYIEKLEDNLIFKSLHNIVWRCLNCGYAHKGMEPPEKCPACVHPRAYFEAV